MLDLLPILEAVRQAADLCRTVQNTRIAPPEVVTDDSVARKIGAEPVTIADYGSQAIISRAISRAFPDDAIIAEEGGVQFQELISREDQQEITDLIGSVLGESVTIDQVTAWLDYGHGREAARTWVIDPIDGTKGFIALRHYAIAVGFLEGGQPAGGVMGVPTYPVREGGLIFYAQDGTAFAESLSGGAAWQVNASQRIAPESLVVVESVEKSHASHELMAEVRDIAGIGAAPIHRIDSQAKYAMIAAGDADLYLRLPRIHSTRPHMIWDHAAGAAIVTASGGIVSDVDGSALDFSLGPTLAKNKGMIVANPRIHAAVVEAARQVMNKA